MITLQIAGLTICVKGFDTSLFRERTAEYQCSCERVDLEINCQFCNEIPVPSGTLVACGRERHWLKDDCNYSFYDSILINGRETVIASVTANEDWSCVQAFLKDVEPLGGPAADIRNFNLAGEVFRWFLLFHQGMILHSSCLKCQDKAIAFSAPSGTGKSTHTGLWRNYYPVQMINDDSPAIRLFEGKITAFGTPWSGKSDINHNIFAPLHCIVFLEQAKENRLTEIAGREVSVRLLRELTRPVYPELLQKTLDFMEQMVKHIPAYLLQCTISQEAAELSHSLL